MPNNNFSSFRRSSSRDDLDLTFSSHTAGYDVGFAHGQRNASHDLAREWLHNDARMWTGLAIHNAAAKGPHWAEAMRQAATDGAA